MSKVGILFPHQLFSEHPILKDCDDIYLVEEQLFFKQYAFHKQKIAFHRASMKAFEQLLSKTKTSVHYISSHEALADIRKLIPAIHQEHQPEELHIINPTDDWLLQRIEKSCASLDIVPIIHENPLFLLSSEELPPFFRADKSSFFQTTFYKQQRKRLNLLLENDDSPVGGKWTFDTENRKKYPKKKTPPKVNFPDSSHLWEEAVDYVKKHFPNNLGEFSQNPIYPFTHEQAQAWFEEFLKTRFEEFGAYEDAIVMDESILHHSLLSPLINIGLLLPEEIVEKSIAFAEKTAIPINSTEGFIRQIIGWREFIRGMYECKGGYSRTRNFWGFKRKMPKSFYDGSTGILPFDHTIKKVLETGYCHHIERLMILGNFMLLCEIDPNEVYQWFMELFIDAYDWVMVPNVYGMSQFADGGLFATKPYIAGSNYLKKMSNYPNGSWQETWDGLFWRFIHTHRDFFEGNPRLSMMVHTLEKMDESKREKHLKTAEAFLNSL